MPLIQLSNPPLTTPFNDGTPPVFIGRSWYDWFLGWMRRVQTAPYVVGTVALTAQEASIPATPIIPLATSGVYRVSWYLRITRAAGAASSILVTFLFTESGLGLTQAGPAEAGNTVTTVQSGTFLLRADPSTPISYSTTYASAGVPTMQYRIDIVLKAVS